MTRIFVDADACPVKEEAARVAMRHGLSVIYVANAWMRLPDGEKVERVVVPDGPDAADDWIAQRAGKGDIVITQDIPLASRALKRGHGPSATPASLSPKPRSAWPSPCANSPSICVKSAKVEPTTRRSARRTGRRFFKLSSRRSRTSRAGGEPRSSPSRNDETI